MISVLLFFLKNIHALNRNNEILRIMWLSIILYPFYKKPKRIWIWVRYVTFNHIFYKDKGSTVLSTGENCRVKHWLPGRAGRDLWRAKMDGWMIRSVHEGGSWTRSVPRGAVNGIKRIPPPPPPPAVWINGLNGRALKSRGGLGLLRGAVKLTSGTSRHVLTWPLGFSGGPAPAASSVRFYFLPFFLSHQRPGRSLATVRSLRFFFSAWVVVVYFSVRCTPTP